MGVGNVSQRESRWRWDVFCVEHTNSVLHSVISPTESVNGRYANRVLRKEYVSSKIKGKKLRALRNIQLAQKNMLSQHYKQRRPRITL